MKKYRQCRADLANRLQYDMPSFRGWLSLLATEHLVGNMMVARLLSALDTNCAGMRCCRLSVRSCVESRDVAE